MENSRERTKLLKKISMVGLLANLLLAITKLTAGILGRSSAMVADAMNSVSDFTTDIVLIIFVRFASKEKDHDHRYGHGKFETFATMIISVVLIAVGIGIFLSGVDDIMKAVRGEVLPMPGMIALIVAVLSIITKEILYHYTIKIGKKINSKPIIAKAWDHRSDVLSTIGTLLGIAGAIYLGESWRVLDPIAGLLVSIIILKVSWGLLLPSIKELLETSLTHEEEDKIIEIITSVDGVFDPHNLKTRNIGNVIAIEIHVKVDPQMTVALSHDIATEIEKRIRNEFGRDTHIAVHIEPFYEYNDGI